jgi:O-6-methylguanine DNA methyltransferase
MRNLASARKSVDALAVSGFQKRVLRAVLSIPRGETRSYRQIAEQIGDPRAYRAVGNALNKNPLPLVVPCHRVIRSDGRVGGYRFGTRRKASLLITEGAPRADK